MPKKIPHEVRNKAMQLYLEGRAAKDIATVITKDSNVTVKPSTIYAWANMRGLISTNGEIVELWRGLMR